MTEARYKRTGGLFGGNPVGGQAGLHDFAQSRAQSRECTSS
jgi:hypothetical protein